MFRALFQKAQKALNLDGAMQVHMGHKPKIAMPFLKRVHDLDHIIARLAHETR